MLKNSPKMRSILTLLYITLLGVALALASVATHNSPRPHMPTDAVGVPYFTQVACPVYNTGTRVYPRVATKPCMYLCDVVTVFNSKI